MSELKHSLINFTWDDIRDTTNIFDEANRIGSSFFFGMTNAGKYALQQVDSDEEVRHAVYILTRINHLNVIKLKGCCCEKKPYLVFEYAENGSLRDCLSSKKTAKQLTWTRRIQIAFDLAVGLHYLHYSTNPSFIHSNINSGTVLITTDWRAKISGFGLAKAVTNADGCVCKSNLTLSKTDVYAFGVVLLELLSGNGKCVKESVRFLETLNSSSERLRESSWIPSLMKSTR